MGIGSRGTVSDVGQYLKSKNLDVKHRTSSIHEIASDSNPDILDMNIIEEVLMVSSKDAVNMAREPALKEAFMVRISSRAML
uniref:Bifunctional L-3-cyanoalanine synthase/cysteine synthase 1, mitochondrial n=1 Tax=Tanacetum cinerariifolium TaxID=118510 RepID=A0A6L2KI13_TANCI|nr:bifunctional L-3-cyanoalanine synthase/cysteine synthase 1, mitochondrial [Tanacetum cinerariifolium]